MPQAECLFGLIAVQFDPVPSMEGVLALEIVVRGMESALPALQNCVPLIVYYWLTVLLPMYVFPRMRHLIVSSLRASALLIGIVCWWESFIVTYRMLGVLAVIVGTLFAGVGVVPLAIFASASRDDGGTFGEIMLMLVLALVARSMAKRIVNRISGTRHVRVRDYEV